MSIRKILAIMAIGCCLVSALSTLLYFQHAHRTASQSAQTFVKRNAEMITASLDTFIQDHQRAAAVLAGLPTIQKFFDHPDDSVHQQVISILNHSCQSMNASLCYVLDINGVTLVDNTNASTVSLVGNNYAFRPYFTTAREYGYGTYMAVGATTRKRGIYFSHQIRNSQGEISGVLVIKLPPTFLEERFKFSGEGIALMLDPNGVIFASTKEAWVLHSLTEIPVDVKNKLVESRQFGLSPLESLNVKEKDEHLLEDDQGESYLFAKHSFRNLTGWNLMYLSDTKAIPFGFFSDNRSVISFALVIMITGIAVVFLYRAGNADINRRRMAEEELQQSEERLQQLIALSNEAIIIHHNGQIIDANEIAVRMFGYNSIEDLEAHLIWELFDPHTVSAVRRHCAENYELPYEAMAVDVSGRHFPTEISAKTSYLRGKEIRVCCIQDITERLEEQKKMMFQAYHDSLTGLPNRNYMMERLEKAVEHARRYDQQVAIMFVDLDDFKKINDTVGHSQGDQLLVAATTRLQGVLRDADTLARLGGDEFIIILEDFKDPAEIESIATRVLDVLSREFILDNQQYLYISGSVGIATYPEDARSIDQLMQCADTAMYEAKYLGRNRYQFFTEEMREQVRTELAIEKNMRTALDNDEFSVHYQPICDTQTGKLLAVEALLRWHNAELGNIPPDRFIPIAEQTGMIVEIGEWLVRQVSRQTAYWRDQGYTQLTSSINISPRQFHDPGLLPLLQQVLADTLLPPQCICLEVTEGLLLKDDVQSRQTFERIQKLGLHIALDDFGTGYSALGYLKRFPFSHLKIDRSFVDDLGSDSSDRKLIEATIAMSKGLGLSVIAEGVETEEQLQILKETGCHAVQGFLISRPLPAEEFSQKILPVLASEKPGLRGIC